MVSLLSSVFEFKKLLTAGLKRPPVTRKKAQTLTVKEKPKDKAEYKRLEVFGYDPGSGNGVLAT
jgi:hypothetical protein